MKFQITRKKQELRNWKVNIQQMVTKTPTQFPPDQERFPEDHHRDQTKLKVLEKPVKRAKPAALWSPSRAPSPMPLKKLSKMPKMHSLPQGMESLMVPISSVPSSILDRTLLRGLLPLGR